MNRAERTTVDVFVLTRDEGPLHREVEGALHAQAGVSLRIHRLIGRPLPDDTCRWETIARARNEARARLAASGVAGIGAAMFVDDDVVLGDDCVRSLLDELNRRPNFGALAANYKAEPTLAGQSVHVAMGATLFRVEALRRVPFRWTKEKCECRCCCDDLRRLGFAIAYLPTARAWHLPESVRSAIRQSSSIAATEESSTSPFVEPNERPAYCGQVEASRADDASEAKDERATSNRSADRSTLPGRVLAAFNRRHLEKFRNQFLATLRRSGNDERVTAVGYGLRPSERRALASLPGVEVIALPTNGVLPPIRRLYDFQTALASLPPETPVAYWDSGDVLFQSRLEPLWAVAASNPTKLLAVREPKGYPENAAVVGWTRTIRDPYGRRRTFELLARNPFLNSGFAAGTAASMQRYLVEAVRLRKSSELFGTADWGDQTALNVYCHQQPDRWLEVAEGWNFCLHDRPRGEIGVRPDGRIVSRRGVPIYVAHGNARSQRKLALLSQQLRAEHVRRQHAPSQHARRIW